MILGISGGIATGKTFLMFKLSTYLQNMLSVPIQTIQLDDLRRNALWYSNTVEHIEFRKKLANEFKISISDNNLNRMELTHKIFDNTQNFNLFREISIPVLRDDLKNKLNDYTINIIEWTYLEEDGYHDLLTHNLIHLEEDLDLRLSRLTISNETQNTDILNRLKYEVFKKKQLVTNSNVDIKSLLTSIGIKL